MRIATTIAARMNHPPQSRPHHRFTRSPGPRWALVLIAALGTHCATSASEPGTMHPANPSAARGPETPPFTSLAGNDLPEVEPANGTAAAPQDHDHDHGAMPGMAGMDHDHGAMPGMAGMDHGDGGAEASAGDDAERAAFAQARPVFERYCMPCHSAAGAHSDPTAMGHLSMNGYPFGGHHAGMAGGAVREVLGASGSPATMPLDHPGAVQGQDLAVVLAWADAFDHVHGAPPPGGDDDDDDHDHPAPAPAGHDHVAHPHGAAGHAHPHTHKGTP